MGKQFSVKEFEKALIFLYGKEAVQPKYQESLSECCEAAVTFVEGELVCKKCFSEQSLEVLSS